MKTRLLFAAVAVACATPFASIAADHNLYGQLRYSFNAVDDVTGSGLDGLSGQDNVSLFGLKGSVGDKIKAFYHLQTGAKADSPNSPPNAFNQRFYFGGLQGAFGKLAYGRMTNAYKFAGFKLDPFYNLSHINAGGIFAAGGATYGLSPATNGFTDNALQYVTPAFSGFKVNAGIYIDDSNQDEHGSGVGAFWSNKAWNVGVQYAAQGQVVTLPGIPVDGNALRLYGGYKGKTWNAAASYEQVDNAAGSSPSETTYGYLTGTWKPNKDTRLVGSIGSVDDGNPSAEGTGFTLGAFYMVVPKTEIYLLYSGASLDAAGAQDPSVFAIGAIHKFGFGG